MTNITTPLAPTDAEIAALYTEQTGFILDDSPAALLDFARAVLDKWGQPAHSGEPFAWHVCSVNSDGSLSLEHAAAWEEAAHEHINDAITEHDIEGAGSWVVRPAYHAPQPVEREPLTPREIELIDGMIEVQLDHAMRCDAIANRVMADKQKGWDMERVALLQKFKAAHGIKKGGQHGAE